MACCFGRRRARSEDSAHDVYLYPAAGDGEVLFQYGGALRPELVYAGDEAAMLATVAAGDAMAASAALAASAGPGGAAPQAAGVTRRELDRCAPESVVGRAPRRRRVRPKLRPEPQPHTPADPAADCSICLEGIAKGERARTLPCRHAYHSSCIQQWLASSIVCPVCMQTVVHRTPAGSVVDGDTSLEM